MRRMMKSRRRRYHFVVYSGRDAVVSVNCLMILASNLVSFFPQQPRMKEGFDR